MAGLVMSYALQITQMYTYMTRQSVEVENNMNSVERSKFYADGLESEAPDVLPSDAKRDQPESMWPSKGQIVLHNVSMKYRPELPLVLKNISITIHPGERIGVVGRTGAGKTTLMSALFRLTEICEGTIEIDGQNIREVGLDQLRSRLAIIPQESVLWSGTIRSNLDPFNRFTDAELWDAIEQAHMKTTVEAMGGLEGLVQDQGENVSVGQRAQLCLARALLKRAKILILDEATANVDLETDALIQSALLKLNCTVLAIAHRLLTIIEFDRVMVMQHGSLVEFDSPYNLLKNPNTIFSSLIAETGPDNARMLRSLAERAEATRRKRLSITLESPVPVGQPPSAPSASTSGNTSSTESLQRNLKQNYLQALQSPYKFDQINFSPSSSICEPSPAGLNGPNGGISSIPGRVLNSNPATASSSERCSDHRDEDEEYFIFSPQQRATANNSGCSN
jgi:ABC-type multidrug transport system ATPase subunit